ELSPFGAGAQLALVAPQQDTQVLETLKRIGRLFTSNFDFLTLSHQSYAFSRAKGKLETQLKEMTAKATELERVLGERETQLADARKWSAEMELSAQGWARECEQNAAHTRQVEHELRTLTSGRAWSVVQRLVHLRHRLVPRNSLRERCGRFVLRVQRRLRGWVLLAR